VQITPYSIPVLVLTSMTFSSSSLKDANLKVLVSCASKIR